jgi:hypothetical protein
MLKMDLVKLNLKFFKDQGFKLNKSQLLFEKVFPNGKQVISVHFIEEMEEAFVEYHLGVRINEVEELVLQYLPTICNPAEQSITIVQRPNKLSNSYPKRIKVSNKEEVINAIHLFENFFLESGFKWLDRMMDPIILEQEFLLQNDICFEDNNLVESAFRSTAMSRLFNSENYQIVRQSFLEKINSLDLTPFTIASFLQLLNYLDKVKLKVA